MTSPTAMTANRMEFKRLQRDFRPETLALQRPVHSYSRKLRRANTRGLIFKGIPPPVDL